MDAIVVIDAVLGAVLSYLSITALAQVMKVPGSAVYVANKKRTCQQILIKLNSK